MENVQADVAKHPVSRLMDYLSQTADRLVFESLLAPHWDYLRKVARSKAGNDEDANDLLQDTAVKAYRSFHQFAIGSNFKAWLFSILLTTWTDTRRRLERQRPSDTVSLDNPVGDASDGNDATWQERLVDLNANVEEEALMRVAREEQGQEVRKAFVTLPRLQKQILLMDFANDPKPRDEDIAVILGTTVNTVRNQRSLAKETLRKHFAARGFKSADVDQLLSDFVSGSQGVPEK